VQEVRSRRQARELGLAEIKVVFDRREVRTRLVGLSQR
jgi:hypothetical protein